MTKTLLLPVFASMLFFSIVAVAEQPDLSIAPCLDRCKEALDRCVDTSRSFIVPDQLKKQVDVCEEKGEFCARECYDSGKEKLAAYRQCLEKLALNDELEKRERCMHVQVTRK